MELSPELQAEADAFNNRIRERLDAGFVPDLRMAVKCAYFYKSFWRDPHFVELYLGKQVKNLLGMAAKYGRKSLRVLDGGCGAGYVSLEFARAGHRVLGIDIAADVIDAAIKQKDTNPFTEGFGSLEYQVVSLEKVSGVFDCVLFTGVLHHLTDPDRAMRKAMDLLSPRGLVLCYEPCHDQWQKSDAAQVALIRMLLSMSGYWYEGDMGTSDDAKINGYVEDVFTEYVQERDKHEKAGQSPSDNSSEGSDILASLRKHFEELEYRPGNSFIYRLLGGLRGPDEKVYKIADFLAAYEEYAVRQRFMRPNGFYFAGRKREQDIELG